MHKPRKRFGQHFLHDRFVIQHLVDLIHPLPGQALIEIGPGQGALTIPILKKSKELNAIELDRDLIPILKERSAPHGRLILHESDALQFDFAKLNLTEPLRIIGNLPYNISTPLIFHLLHYASRIKDMHFMLQKELVDRIAAQPGTADYGRLSVMVQYHCQAVSLFDVPPEAFFPPPKVTSSIVRLIPYQQIPYPAKNYAHFAAIVKEAFNHRRKTLRNCLKQLMQSEEWEQVGIDSSLRPEQLSVADYVKLSER